MHETIQTWLEVMYHDKVKNAKELDKHKLLYENMIKSYKQGKAQNGHEHFSTQDELTKFWIEGKHILDFLEKKRGGYFSTKNMQLAGIETLLYQEIRPGVMFKGLVDLVFYHPNTDRWTIMDIKTSTSGWRDAQKKNPNLTAQVILYREFFAKQFGIDKDKTRKILSEDEIEKIISIFQLNKKQKIVAHKEAISQRMATEYKFWHEDPKIVINEFMASNVSAVTDQDGEYDDWIETVSYTHLTLPTKRIV